MTALTDKQKQKRWEDISLRSIGYKLESLVDLKAEIDKTNGERTVPYTAEECRVKFLDCINTPDVLLNKAIGELQQSTYLDAAGNPSYDGTFAGFDELWRHYVTHTNLIKMTPARDISNPSNPGPSNRFDSMQLTEEPSNLATEEYGVDLGTDGEPEIFAFLTSGERVKICWKCCGIDHTKAECKSGRKTSLSDAIALLQQAIESQGGRGQGSPTKRRFFQYRTGTGGGRGRGGYGGGKGTGRPNVFHLECDEEGNLYDPETNECIGCYNEIARDTAPVSEAMQHEHTIPTPAPPAFPVAEERSNQLRAESVLPDPVSPNSNDASAVPHTPHPTPAGAKPTAMVWSSETMLDEMAVSHGGIEESDLWDQEHDVPATDTDMLPLQFSLFGIVLLIVAKTLGFLKKAFSSIWFTPAVLVLACLAARCLATSVSQSGTIQIGRGAIFCMEMGGTLDAGRQYCNMDTGTSKPASGKRSRFPTSAVSNWKPNMNVRVASGTRLPVEFIGIMVLHLHESVLPKPISAANSTNSPPSPRTDIMDKLGFVDALYVPGMPDGTTLVSPLVLKRKQGTECFFNDECFMLMPNGSKIKFTETDIGYFLPFHADFDATNLQTHEYYVPSSSIRDRVANFFTHEVLTSDRIHNRLCHFSFDRIFASAQCTKGLNLGHVKRCPCPSCVRGGTNRRPTKPVAAHRQRKYTRFGQRVSSDSCAMPKSTPFGFENMVTFYDHGTKTLDVYYTKGHTAEEIKQCHMQYEADHKEDLLWCKGHVLVWSCDNHGEFKSDKIDDYLLSIGQRQEFIVPWQPQQNPAERANSIVLRPLRICLAHSNSSVRCWPFVTTQIVMVHNSLANRSETAFMPGRSAYEMRTGRIPDLSMFRVPLCRMLANIRAKRDLTVLGKLAPRNTECIHLCWDRKRHGYFGYSLEFRRLTTWRAADCRFFEDEFPRCEWIVGDMLNEQGITGLPSQEEQESSASAYRKEVERLAREHLSSARPPEAGPIDNEIEQPDGEQHEPDQGRDLPWQLPELYRRVPPALPFVRPVNDAGPLSNKSPRRQRERHNQEPSTELVAWDDESLLPLTSFAFADAKHCLCLNVTAATTYIPTSYSECSQTPEAPLWRDALTTHMEGKMKNGTCTFMALPPGKTAIKSKLVPGLKYNEQDGTISSYTMRWVACGYSQVNVGETFTATTKASAIRVFVCQIMMLGLTALKTDVPKAFTRAEIDEEIYVEQPEAKKMPGLLCKQRDKNGNLFVALLHKALEGLKQAGHLFQKLNTNTLLKLGFKQLVIEPTIFILHRSEGLIALLIWIDDFAIGTSSRKIYTTFIEEYRKIEGMDIKEEGPLTIFAGIQFTWGKDYVELCQSNGIERGVLRHFPEVKNMQPVQLPATYDTSKRTTSLQDCALSKEGDDIGYVSKYPPYLSFVALALYYAGMSRGDLQFVTTFLSRFMASPNEACYKAGLQLLACLYYTRKECIRYTTNSSNWNLPPQIARHGLLDQVLSNFGIYVCPDASWKIRTAEGLNMTYGGFVIFMCGAALDWACKLIRVICHSSAEAEICSGCQAGKRLTFIRNLIEELAEQKMGKALQGAVIFLIDNSACEPLTKNVGVSKPTEHFARWQLYLRWMVYHKFATVLWIDTDNETGDIMTKVLAAAAYLKHKRVMLNKI